MFIVDALVGNFDRHCLNWGFIKRDGAYSLAPVFDNGSCLFPALVDEDDMLRIIDSEDETAKRVFGFPTSQIRLHGRKSSYCEVISSLEFEECNRALRAVMERADLEAMLGLVAFVPGISDVQRLFYSHMLDARFRGILEASYRSLSGRRQ